MSLTFPSQRMWKEAGMGGKGTSPRGRAEVLISFTWLTQSQWQADGCTLNATFFFFFFFFSSRQSVSFGQAESMHFCFFSSSACGSGVETYKGKNLDLNVICI